MCQGHDPKKKKKDKSKREDKDKGREREKGPVMPVIVNGSSNRVDQKADKKKKRHGS